MICTNTKQHHELYFLPLPHLFVVLKQQDLVVFLGSYAFPFEKVYENLMWYVIE